jgi:large subunit ribosomal protein L15
MRLNDLRDNPGATRAKKRVGRGPGSGLGKTAGRGVKGQKSRTGVAIKGFEGGQMPIHMRIPKRGFNNPFAKTYNEVNLGRIQAAIDAGKLDAGKPVTMQALREAGVIRRDHDGVRLLGSGELKAKLAFEIAHATAGARAAVEKAGGSVKLLDRETSQRKIEDREKKQAKTKAKGKGRAAKDEAKGAKAKAKDANAEAGA